MRRIYRLPVSMADFYAGLHPDDLDMTSEAFAGAADPARRALYDVEYRTIGQEDGAVRWVAARGRGVFDASGPDARCLRVIGTAIDISARKRVEAELRELNERLEQRVAERTVELRRFREIVDATISPICAFDTEYRLIAFNKAHNDEFRRVNGFDSELGDVFPDLFIPEQRPVMRALMARALSGERFTIVEEFGRPELGQPFWEITTRRCSTRRVASSAPSISRWISPIACVPRPSLRPPRTRLDRARRWRRWAA